jgi:hypothetical protein
VQAHKRALAGGGELRLVLPASAAVRRVFEITGIDHVIPNFAGLDQALEPAPATAPATAAPTAAAQAGDASRRGPATGRSRR